MHRIDGAYLYQLGASLRPILNLPSENTTKLQIYHLVTPSLQSLDNFLDNSVFTPHIRTVRQSAVNLSNKLRELEVDFERIESFDEEVYQWKLVQIKDDFKAFENILIAELQNSPLYLLLPKGGFDLSCLTDSGILLFPSTLSLKVPDAVSDAAAAAKCIAFELFTAAGFHLHRANEAVLRRYFDAAAGAKNRPRSRNIGDYLKKMESLQVGDPKVIAVLRSIKDLHRNPLMHPEDRIENADEALSLYAAVRAAIGYMVDRIPYPVQVAELAFPATELTADAVKATQAGTDEDGLDIISS